MVDPLIALLVAGVVAAVGIALFWPGRGLLHGRRQARRANERVRAEDALKYLYESELNEDVPSLHSLAGAVHVTVDEVVEVLDTLQTRGLVRTDQGEIQLTPAGRKLGLHVLRAHRLWESYLANQTAFPEVEWHGRAHELEHGLTPAEADALSAQLQHPTHDPHGDPIPTAEGDIAGQRGVPLTLAPTDRPLRIAHMEDEPKAVYAQLVVLGLYPGLQVRVAELSPQRVTLLANGAEHVLAPLVAASVSVIPLSRETRIEPIVGEPLSALRPGEEAKVVSISRRCRGPERRRLMDLGVLPGTVVRAEMASPTGDPTAYRVREALIALRAEQAEFIRVERLPKPAARAA